MSKYIRTKYGVYEEKETVGGLKYFEIQTVGSAYYNLCRNDKLWNDFVIKEADTIEKLVDEFVYIEYKKPRVLDSVITREIKEKGIKVAETIYCYPNWNGIIYGAVWCDFGLKYVAKLNDRGELELI